MKTKNKYFKINRELNFNNILSLEDEIYVKKKLIRNNQYELSFVSSIMMSECNEFYNFFSFINREFENKTLEDMNSSFSRKIVSQCLEMFGIRTNRINFVFKNFIKEFIFLDGLIDFLPTFRVNSNRILYFSSNISLTELTIIEDSFLLFSNSLTYFAFKGNSSTGCQSILSQNFQSLLVTLQEFKYFLNISFLRASSLAIEDQLIQENKFNLSLKLSSIEIIMLTIYNSPLECNFSSTSSFFIIPCFMTSGQLTSGCLSNCALNSFDIDTVNLFILNTPHNCVNTRKCVHTYKCCAFEISVNEESYSFLQRISFSDFVQTNVQELSSCLPKDKNKC